MLVTGNVSISKKNEFALNAIRPGGTVVGSQRRQPLEFGFISSTSPGGANVKGRSLDISMTLIRTMIKIAMTVGPPGLNDFPR